MQQRRSGFTLIELLVVIAIIAILAAILFPVFARVKEQGKKTACKSNMRQIAVAIQIYVDAWNSCFPDQNAISGLGFSYGMSYSDDAGGLWITQFAHRYREDTTKLPAGLGKVLGPYLKTLSVFKCPSERKDRPADLNGWQRNIPYVASSSYYYKHALCYYANSSKHPMKLSEISAPTKVTLLYEDDWHAVKGRQFVWDPGFYKNNPNREPYKRLSAIFMDTHIGTIDTPWNNISGYDPNWFFYGDSADPSRSGRDKP